MRGQKQGVAAEGEEEGHDRMGSRIACNSDSTDLTLSTTTPPLNFGLGDLIQNQASTPQERGEEREREREREKKKKKRKPA